MRHHDVGMDRERRWRSAADVVGRRRFVLVLVSRVKCVGITTVFKYLPAAMHRGKWCEKRTNRRICAHLCPKSDRMPSLLRWAAALYAESQQPWRPRRERMRCRSARRYTPRYNDVSSIAEEH